MGEVDLETVCCIGMYKAEGNQIKYVITHCRGQLYYVIFLCFSFGSLAT